MTNCIKVEFKKAFNNRMLLLSLLIGLIICMLDVFQNADAVTRLTAVLVDSDDTLSKSAQGFSLFVRWIAVNGFTFGNYAFYFVWPILAAIPYGWSYVEERKSGIYNQIVSRVGKKNYYNSKYIALFCSGGLTISIPVLMNLLINALVCPYCVPDVVSSMTSVTNGYFLSALFYSQPWVWGLLWCGVEFLWGGTAACLCLVVGTKLRHQVMVMLIPFIIFLIVDVVVSVLGGTTIANLELSPLRLAQAAPNSPNPEWLVFSIIGLFTAITYIAGYRQVVSHEFI